MGERAGDDDREIFARLFDQHVDLVYRFAARRLGSSADAEDLTSIVFMTAWRRRADLRSLKGSLVGWLLVTAEHSANNLARARRREAALVDRLALTRDPATAVDGVEDPVNELSDDFKRSLNKLKEADRQILVLAVVAELSYEEIAGALGVPVGTVRSRLSRAKERLRKSMTQSMTHLPAARGRA